MIVRPVCIRPGRQPEDRFSCVTAQMIPIKYQTRISVKTIIAVYCFHYGSLQKKSVFPETYEIFFGLVGKKFFFLSKFFKIFSCTPFV